MGAQGRESVKIDGRVALGVGAGGQYIDPVAYPGRFGHRVRGFFVQNIHRIAGWARKDNIHRRPLSFEIDRVFYRLVQGLDKAAELSHIQENPGIALVHRFFRDIDDLRHDDAGISGHGTPRLDDDLFGPVVFEGVVQKTFYIFGVLSETVGGLDIVGGKAAPHVDHLELHLEVFLGPGKQLGHGGEGGGPLADVALLTSGVEGNAVGQQAETNRGFYQLAGEVGVGAEFLGQGPVGSEAFGEKPEENLGARSRPGNLVQVGDGVGDIEPHAFFVEVRYILFFFDGIAETHAIGLDAQPEELVQLEARRHVEGGAKVSQKLDHGVVGIGFDGVINFGEGKVGAQILIVFSDYVQVDDKTGGFLVLGECLDALKSLARHEILERKAVLVFHCRTPSSCLIDPA
ncbi:hypothetical protein SDC9_11520 [bioreactor metagenome]|uniref:Uncharacterized protein n=1 Tax=bioreactor metagenome TaxID=1076179 RepID=A0A644TFV5_9ZZZZ